MDRANEKRESAEKSESTKKSVWDAQQLGGRKRAGIDLERFGKFVLLLRNEKRLSQKQLAEKLFVSNKAVSKWENGLSLPDISLLEPLAEILEVTVSELLHGERQNDEKVTEGQQGKPFIPTSNEPSAVHAVSPLTEEALKEWFSESDAAVRVDDQDNRERRKKGIRLYMAAIFISGLEMLFLYLWGSRLGMGGFDVSMEVLLTVALVLMFGPWFFWVMPERLPSYYDVMSLSYFAYGGMHINMPGVNFNNRNWPYILKGWRSFGFWVPVGWPVCWTLLWIVLRYQPLMEMNETNFSIVILLFRVMLPLGLILGGLFVPTYTAAKKYE